MISPHKIKELIDKQTLIRIFLYAQLIAILYIPEGLFIIYLAQIYGKFTAIAIIIATSLLGLFVMSGSIAAIFHRIARATAANTPIRREIATLFVLLLCGILIVMPGIISAAIGFIIYYSPLRALIITAIIRRHPQWIDNANYYIKLD